MDRLHWLITLVLLCFTISYASGKGVANDGPCDAKLLEARSKLETELEEALHQLSELELLLLRAEALPANVTMDEILDVVRTLQEIVNRATELLKTDINDIDQSSIDCDLLLEITVAKATEIVNEVLKQINKILKNEIDVIPIVTDDAKVVISTIKAIISEIWTVIIVTGCPLEGALMSVGSIVSIPGVIGVIGIGCSDSNWIVLTCKDNNNNEVPVGTSTYIDCMERECNADVGWVSTGIIDPSCMTMTTTAEQTTMTAEPSTTDEATTTTAEPSATDEATTTTAEPLTTDEAMTTTAEPSTTDEAMTTTAEPSTTEKATTTTAELSTTDEATITTVEPSTTDEATTTTAEPSMTDEATTTTAEPTMTTTTAKATTEDLSETTLSRLLAQKVALVDSRSVKLKRMVLLFRAKTVANSLMAYLLGTFEKSKRGSLSFQIGKYDSETNNIIMSPYCNMNSEDSIIGDPTSVFISIITDLGLEFETDDQFICKIDLLVNYTTLYEDGEFTLDPSRIDILIAALKSTGDKLAENANNVKAELRVIDQELKEIEDAIAEIMVSTEASELLPLWMSRQKKIIHQKMV